MSMEWRKSLTAGIVVLLATAVLAVYLTVPSHENPKFMTSWNSTIEGDHAVVRRGGEVIANFSGRFAITVYREFGRIHVHISTLERSHITDVKVYVRRNFLNGLYMELEPPCCGAQEIIHQERVEYGVLYIIHLRNLQEAGKGDLELTFIDRALEKEFTIRVEVEAKEHCRPYRGEAVFVIMNPYKSGFN